MPQKGYKQTEEHKDKHLSKIRRENNGNWKGGIKVDNLRAYENEKSKEWRDSHKEQVSYNSFRRKQRVKNAEGTFSLEQWLELKEMFGNMCLSCKRKEPEIKLQKDHIVPLDKGGTNYIENIQPLCGTCNKIKYLKVVNFRLEVTKPL